MEIFQIVAGIILSIIGGLGLKWMIVDLLLKGVASANVFGLVAGLGLLYFFGTIALVLFLAGIFLIISGFFD